MPTRIIAVANQKGGVGKTTTAVNLAACLAQAGKRVLLFDLDPQANATSGVGVEKIEGHSAYPVLLGEGTLTEKIKQTPFERLSLIPSEVDLCGADIELARSENHLHRVAQLLQPIAESAKFDLILVDCPPSLGILTLNAFAAADGILVPLQCEYYALEGISMMNRVLTQLREGGVNPRLEIFGVVMTMFDARTKLSNEVVSEVRNLLGERVFETVIPRSTKLAEAPSFGKPIIHYDKYSVGAAAYEVLAQEVLTRLTPNPRRSQLLRALTLMAKEPVEMLIESVTQELPDTKTLHLKWPDGHDPDFKTGQFITVYWPDTPEYKRAYSLSSCALDRGFYEITVKREGRMGTRMVDWSKAGQKLFVLPPVGKFLPAFEPGKQLVCIAGGSGVTPFRAFAREATRRQLENKITVLYSVRTTNDIIFDREFRELALENENFNFYVTCTRLHPEDKWTGRRGRIDPAWVREQIHDLPNTVFYACGPNPLVEFAEHLVVNEMGVPKAQMRTGEVGLIPAEARPTNWEVVTPHFLAHPSTMLKRTPLFAAHQKLGGKLIEFGGWEMPVQYTSITDEHLAVRNAAGIFDISHMGEVTVSGEAAAEFLNRTLTNDIRKLTPGLGQYTLMCNERGAVIDDLYAYCLSQGVYLLIINASRIQPDVAWLQAEAAKFTGELKLTDASHQYSAVAVQGPRVKEFINEVVGGASISAMRVPHATDLKKNEVGGFKCGRGGVLVSRTGYTGEDGFEIVGEGPAILEIWEAVLAKGQPFGIKPCGLGARDTLRTEVCYPLYGHELDENTTPIEAGVGFFVSLDKGEFNGRSVLADQKANGVKKKCIAFTMAEKCAPPRPHYPIWANDAKVGEVVSGTQSPSLNNGIGLGYVPPEFAKPGTAIEIEIRGKQFKATVVQKPIYRKG